MDWNHRIAKNLESAGVRSWNTMTVPRAWSHGGVWRPFYKEPIAVWLDRIGALRASQIGRISADLVLIRVVDEQIKFYFGSVRDDTVFVVRWTDLEEIKQAANCYNSPPPQRSRKKYARRGNRHYQAA